MTVWPYAVNISIGSPNFGVNKCMMPIFEGPLLTNEKDRDLDVFTGVLNSVAPVTPDHIFLTSNKNLYSANPRLYIKIEISYNAPV